MDQVPEDDFLRSLLFVPADSERKLQRALESGADALILDLEDSVAAERKPNARAMAAEFMASLPAGAPKILVRVNDLETGLTDDDVAAVVPAKPFALMLPKAAGAADVARLSTKLRVVEARSGLEDGATGVLPIITETGAAVLSAHSYTQGAGRLVAITWGAEDLSSDIGAERTRTEDGSYTDVFRLARAVTVLAAAAAQCEAIDTVYPNFRDEEGFARDCRNGMRDGFTGRMAIHPAQVAVINEVFTPSTEGVARARAIVEAFAAAGDPGVVSIDGEMFDRPHLRRAHRLLRRAREAGLLQDRP